MYLCTQNLSPHVMCMYMYFVLYHTLSPFPCRYLTQGLPTIIATYIPFLLHGVWLVLKYGRGNHTHLSLYLGMWLVVSHSFLKHKEFRFVQPFIPLTSAYIGI